MSFSNYLERMVLDRLFDLGGFSPPAISVGLSRTNPGEVAGSLSEPSVDDGYTRIECDDWENPTGSEILNTVAIEFPVATGDWGVIRYFALFDADNNMLLYGILTNAQEVSSGYQTGFEIGKLSVTLD